MATTIESQSTPVSEQPESGGQRPADVFVIFGITGDLAKVMTFRSLYRLERRGLLQCPIVRSRGQRLDARPARGASP
jgi:glucose-6-phosphate 1-dehydrogenase